MTMENNKGKKKLSNVFLMGFIAMNIGGIFLFVRDAQNESSFYNFFAAIGYLLTISGFILCLFGMVRHWMRFFSNLNKP